MIRAVSPLNKGGPAGQLQLNRKERASEYVHGSSFWSASRNNANNAWYSNGNNGYLNNNNMNNSNLAVPVVNYSKRNGYEDLYRLLPGLPRE